MISQSSSTQPVASSSNTPDCSSAAAARSSTLSRIGGSLKNGRPERVHTEPRSPVATPNRLRAVAASRHTTMSAREPMCFSWQTTVATPSRR